MSAQSQPSADAGSDIPRSPVDLAKVKPGDELWVRGVADCVRDFNGGAQILVKVEEWRRNSGETESWSYVGVTADQLASHTPKPEPLKVGDRVRWALESYPGFRTGILRAVLGDRAWVDLVDDDEPLNGLIVGLSWIERDA